MFFCRMCGETHNRAEQCRRPDLHRKLSTVNVDSVDNQSQRVRRHEKRSVITHRDGCKCVPCILQRARRK